MLLSADLLQATAYDLIQRRQAEAAHDMLVAEARRYRAAPAVGRQFAAARVRAADVLRAVACRLDPTAACVAEAAFVLSTRRS